jgi:predicted metal-dependent hydrolase
MPALRLSNARTQWGSCSARGRVLLNWRLVLMPGPLIDYVVAHELAHLKELNHSQRFWTLVEGLYPAHLQARRALERLGRQLPEL